MKQKFDFYIIDNSEDLLHEFEFTNSVSTLVHTREGLAALLDNINGGNKLTDIIFLDIRMPEMDGFEFIATLEAKLESTAFSTKVLILSSINHTSDFEAFQNHSIANEFLNNQFKNQKF